MAKSRECREDIGNISLFADLDRVSSREAAAIQSIESKLLGNDPGGLGALAQAAGRENADDLIIPGVREPHLAPTPVDINMAKGVATKDYGAFQVEVDLNRITQDEADALQAAEIKIERPNPLRQQIRGLGGIAQTMAQSNKTIQERSQAEGSTGNLLPGTPGCAQGFVAGLPSVPVYAPSAAINYRGNLDDQIYIASGQPSLNQNSQENVQYFYQPADQAGFQAVLQPTGQENFPSGALSSYPGNVPLSSNQILSRYPDEDLNRSSQKFINEELNRRKTVAPENYMFPKVEIPEVHRKISSARND
ncbi:uncharacterized protein LOC136037145 [Artemia franciscana]|uniref:Uncharacterized protein n=1 Tax=Artemia franciscana TaxID=6661 RepID=A0AA88HU57_ARTSF|nr:hypothetical protein QYM36_010741 [Artemia franciscana]